MNCSTHTYGTYFLYAATKRFVDVGHRGYLVEVAVSADEEVESEVELCERASRLTGHCWLVVDSQRALASSSP